MKKADDRCTRKKSMPKRLHLLKDQCFRKLLQTCWLLSKEDDHCKASLLHFSPENHEKKNILNMIITFARNDA